MYEPGLEAQYSTLGLIEPGDPYKILEKPIIQNGIVIKKGKLTKVRR